MHDPEMALAATSAIDMAVIISGVRFGCVKISSGTSIKPPPAPMSVPIVPISKPVISKTIALSICNFKDMEEETFIDFKRTVELNLKISEEKYL